MFLIKGAKTEREIEGKCFISFNIFLILKCMEMRCNRDDPDTDSDTVYNIIQGGGLRAK